jgi:taurine dioxygenase
MSLPVRKLTSRAGAVIEGADLAAEPSSEVITALRGGLSEHKVIVFDGVKPDDAGLEAAA